jgi:hypothetical protein
MNRRNFLFASALAATLGIPFPSRAVAGNQRKLIFVFAPGGWDITRVFAPAFGNPLVAMEADADRASAGGIDYVAHPLRPSVDQFFSRYHDRSLVLNGMLVRSIAHEICTMIAMTGTSSGTSPDWGAIVADQDRLGYTLPHLVLSGPSFPGDKGVAVARTGQAGQLEALVTGEVENWSLTPVSTPDRVTESVVDRYLARRAEAAAMGQDGVRGRLTTAFADSNEKLRALKDLRYGMRFVSTTLLQDQSRVAVDALAKGVSRCVTISYAGNEGQGWDTHAANDASQTVLWEGLFAGLIELMALLESTPGTAADTLADETLVVVLSELARTPNLNATDGKDHWPHTAALLIGRGITGDRVVGGFDDAMFGAAIDPGSGELDPGGETLSAEALGATVLQWCDVDPGPYVSGVAPLTGVLS